MSFNKTIPSTLGFFLCFMFCWGPIIAQSKKLSETTISLKVKNAPLNQVLSLIEEQTNFKFAYSSDLIANQKEVTLAEQNIPLTKLLAILFKDNTLSYTIIESQIIIQKATAPKKITISGYVKDAFSGQSLSGASVYIPTLNQRTYTNSSSFYSLTINETNQINLAISFDGYEKLNVQVSALKNTVQNFNLTKKTPTPRPINDSMNYIKRRMVSDAIIPVETITTKRLLADTTSLQQLTTNTDTTDIQSEEYDFENSGGINDMLKKISSVSGNGDIMNSIQMTPGVVPGVEGITGYFVRGGNSDQNQVLMDDATLYNPSHFFGLVSILNTSAINNGTLLKEGFPSFYGDNLSSVLDISMKEGSNVQTGGDLQIGTTTSGFTIHGPVIANKSSFILSARRSTIDLWLRPLQSGSYFNNYYFYDVNAKINYQLSPNNRVSLSLYQGQDNGSYSNDSTKNTTTNYDMNYGNQALTLRWNHLYSQKLFSNTSVVYNNYFQSVSASQKKYYAQLYSGIRDIVLKTDLNYYPNSKHKISVGINYLFQTLKPASISNKELSTRQNITLSPSNITEKYSYRLAVYVGDDIKIGQRVQVYLGARLPLYYNNNARYASIEPRFSMLYFTTPSSGIKLSYSQMHQYLHQIKSYNASYPAEIWLESSRVVKPENARQVSVGAFKNFSSNKFQAGLDFYYKEMGNQLLFNGEWQPTITNEMDSTLIFGKGKAYGTEFSLRKVNGKLTGWLSYTVSNAEQQFDSLNMGKPFRFALDRRHCLYITANYCFNSHWEASSNLVIASGSAFTLEQTVTDTEIDALDVMKSKSNNAASQASNNHGNNATTTTTEASQNNYRLNPYHRLDLSISYKNRKIAFHRVLETEWVLSVYNVSAQRNTVFAYRLINPVTELPFVHQVSFLRVIPSITYRLKF